MRLRMAFPIALCALGSAALALAASAQGNYEIQVYPYETVEPRHTMVELHSNFTFQGSKSTDDGTLPTNHQLHETIEITHGFNDWFETGWQSRRYSADTWTWEIRPIIDRQLGPWYLSFNPTFDRSFHGPGVNQGLVFSPNFKFSFNFTKKIAGGLEYYGSLGPVTGFDPVSQQQQQILPAIDLNLSPKWEVNFGLGVGVTRATDHLLAKMILGYRFDF